MFTFALEFWSLWISAGLVGPLWSRIWVSSISTGGVSSHFGSFPSFSSSSSSSSFSSTSRAGRLLWLSKTVSAKLALRLRLQLWQGIPVFLSPHHPLHWRTWTASFFRGDHYVLAKLKVQFFSEIKVLNDDILTVCSCWSQHPTLRKISAEISPQKIHGFGESFLDSLWWIFLRLTRSHLGYLTFSWTDSIWHFRYPWLLALYSRPTSVARDFPLAES